MLNQNQARLPHAGRGKKRSLSRSLLSRLVDRDMPAMREWRRSVGNHQRIELDKAVAFLFVVANDPGTRRELVADLCRGQKLHPAADMNPGTKDGVVDQSLVHHPLQQAG